MCSADLYSLSSNNVKSKMYRALAHGAPNTLTIRDKAEHSWRRRILSSALSDARMASYEDALQRHIDALCENLRAGDRDGPRSAAGTRPVDISAQCDYFTFDVMSEVIFGVKYSCLTSHTHRFASKALETSNVRISVLFQSSLLAVGRLDKYLFPRSIRGRDSFLGFLDSLLRDRRRASCPSGVANVFSFLEKAQDDAERGRGLSKQQIRAECATLVAAGSDTSSTTLAATLFYLSANRVHYQRVVEEIRATFGPSDAIRMGPLLNSCVYLRACIDEALRMSPPAGGALWREVGAGGMYVDSLYVPAGIDVGIGIYSLHHNDKYFERPFDYRPDRWIVGSAVASKESVDLARSAFVPFSRGPRSCLGKGFAYHQVTLALARIIHQFDFCCADEGRVGHEHNGGIAQEEAEEEEEEEYLLRDHITGAKRKTYLRFTALTQQASKGEPRERE
ncbi:APS8 [Purpureocillium lavendulum]|uniref:APS8 n=1 Tax=Purpureocillium lavendulum TaxID=1247861 RepID=A0AB34FV31_9HYPO|nr:APS8 [Purpureocillium lavendulum]